ncbi:MAG TPA: 1,4-alpha-glucan branching protein domain-containing protein [Pyrinomonadaceae bacterium]|nr:1,4-alpha-glucan branching protein domain-containing protein [Pyrinomonadaceae bacterium]
MQENGYLLLVLNSHLPFIRHPEIEYPFEENWLFEAIVESYLPLIGICEELIHNRSDFKITFSLSPPLMEMLADDLLSFRFSRYLDDRIALSKEEMRRLGHDPRSLALAQSYYQRFVATKKLFEQRWHCDLLSAFRYLRESGRVEIITSCATHAYLPLWEHFPKIIRLQIQLGIREFRNVFDEDPKGFWLPECGFFPGLDEVLHREGIRYFFLDAHGLLNGDPRPLFREYAPIHCPSGVATFGRDWQSHDLVWLRDKGYPGDPCYRDFDQDIGFELDLEYLVPFTHSLQRVPTGIKYSRAGTDGVKDVYDPMAAKARCEEHANHFVDACHRQIKQLRSQLGKEPVIAALFDTEHFGHWWHEGAAWLDLVLRKLSVEHSTIKLVTARDYLKTHVTNQVVTPSTSSWGYQGYSETWLMGRNHWIYPALYEKIEIIDRFVQSHAISPGLQRDALNQYFRELLLAQSSDWAFMMHAESNQAYAEKKVRAHIENMTSLYHQISQNAVDSGWLHDLQNKNKIFMNVDILELYLKMS